MVLTSDPITTSSLLQCFFLPRNKVSSRQNSTPSQDSEMDRTGPRLPTHTATPSGGPLQVPSMLAGQQIDNTRRMGRNDCQNNSHNCEGQFPDLPAGTSCLGGRIQVPFPLQCLLKQN